MGALLYKISSSVVRPDVQGILRICGNIVNLVAAMSAVASLHSNNWQGDIVRMQAPYLYLGTDDAVVQLPVNECYRYKMCLACVRDPYCGWDAALHACLPYRDGDRYINYLLYLYYQRARRQVHCKC